MSAIGGFRLLTMVLTPNVMKRIGILSIQMSCAWDTWTNFTVLLMAVCSLLKTSGRRLIGGG